MLSTPTATLATAGTERLRELPMSLWAFGAAKYDTPVGAGHGGSGDSQGSHGATDPGAHH